ncbi:hypothetical protein WR25_01227 [Diploscapter pachys]|uniref:Laminin subunit alpha-2 n=1 Tax=Diploscapter pachys TaxID=2018661 RepID=A0A2A2KPV3_9BILA|nr:hypothetical protein WR25_01227 [Diploscapter pachys]
MSATGGRLLAPWLVVGILILFTTKLILTEEYYDDDSYQEFSASEFERRGLFPNIFNLATNSVITATATCGETHREEYCKLVEHVLLRNYVTSVPGQSPHCAVCDDNDYNKRHPIEYATDGTRKWWQSPSLANGLNYEKVNITIDLRQEYQVAYVILKMAISPRPGTWVLEKSLDGKEYMPWQYFAISDAECMRQFGVPATIGVPRFKRDDEVICSSYYSKLLPIEDGEVHVSLVNDRPGVNHTTIVSEELQRFTRARYVRFRLISPRTLNADLMVIDRKSHRIDKSVAKRYFYAISDISIGGQCICHGHAESCPSDPITGQFKCDCRHNTCGETCDRCCPLFNQLPWKQGTSHDENICQQCQCFNHADSCVYDEELDRNKWSITPEGVYEGGGRCVDCQHDTEGYNCERCKDGFYRPSGMSHYRHDACRPCDCDSVGSVTDVCIKDDQSAHNGLLPGACAVKCAQEGIETIRNASPARAIKLDLSITTPVKRKLASANRMLKNADRQLYYWKAPANFNGNLLNSYGGNLHYYVYYVPSDQGAEVPLPDVVIEGNGMKLEYYGRIEFFPRENMTVQVPIRETNNWFNSATRRQVEKADMMRALAKVEKLLIRAMYKQNQLQSSIFALSLDTAVPAPEKTSADEEDVLYPEPADTKMRGVEVCQCPDNTAGNSCESCAPGYRRVNDQLYAGRCEKCNCNDHSSECHPVTGECINCQHNTTGSRCEKCIAGFYGNPSLGGEEGQCYPCECPTLENNHSPECMMTELIVAEAAAEKEDYFVCTKCDKGYEGNKCELCADGYFGDPMAENGTCQECDCNGNIDPMGIGNCNSTTGLCMKCIDHTDGDHCEVCKPNHWGSAIQHTCRECNCHPQGSTNQQCSYENGDCECKDSYIGKQCDRCKDGHGDVDNGCPACQCDKVGSLGTECDQVSGQCSCKQGVFGKKCDQCRPSYFNFTDAGCQFCHCNTYGSFEGGKCDPVTGKCECRENVDGTMCEKCAEGFFNISSGEGCESCDCNELGSEGKSCDLVTGQCLCKKGVTGLQCDQCMPNHYGLDTDGCAECEPCPADGQICDPETGDCVCPANTVGYFCENCTENAWDYHPLKGCKLCECSDIGSDDGKCDTLTGQCRCKTGYVGRKCDLCTHGFFNFPTCEPCGCDSRGTDPLQCKDGLCLCNDKGECPCKKYAHGTKCDQCAEGTFSLDVWNPKGCTECFCFDRSKTCKQSQLVWQQIYAEDRVAVFEEPWVYHTKRHEVKVLPDYPPRVNSYPTDNVPVYWPLPRIFLGDRITSYNGFLRFKIVNDDKRRGIAGVRPDQQYFRYYSQVILVGNNRIELEHIPYEIKDDGKYKIRLHESEWRARKSPELAVTRKQLMVALQNLQAIYVRGTYNHPARHDSISISEVSLDVAVPQNATGVPATLAVGVEQCSGCPPEYSGLSCQDPAEGYFRKKNRDYLNSPDDIQLIGHATPCICNGHSAKCNAETGVCLDCEHDTYGDFCEFCKPGFIGDAREGGANACTKCACPLVENSFSDTCVAANYGRGYVCNACKPGYTGSYCESCIVGYFGDPQVPGGFCEPCDCHPDGSLHGACNPLTGQCECRPGVTGRDCSSCQERHAFIGGVCTSCDQGCYQPLMIDVDNLEELLHRQNFSNLKPIPWKRLARIGNGTELLFEFVKGLGNMESGVAKDSRYAKEAFSVIEESRFQLERINKSEHTLEIVTEKTQEIINKAQSGYADAFNTTQFLKFYQTYGGSSIGGAALDSWLMECEALLNATKERGEYVEKRHNRAEEENTRNKELLKQVSANKLNQTIFENLKNRVDEFDKWLSEYRTTIHDDARKDTLEAEKMSAVVAKRVERYKEVSNEIERFRVEAEDDLSAARDAVERAKGEELLNLYDDSKHMNETVTRAEDLAEKCNNVTLLYAQLIDDYEEEFAEPAAKHAEGLRLQAQEIGDSFKNTRLIAENPLKAANAYDEIFEAIRKSDKAANDADNAAKAASEKIGINQPKLDENSLEPVPDDYLLTVLERTMNSTELAGENARSTLKYWDEAGLEKDREELAKRLEAVNEHVIDMTKRNSAIKNLWSKFDDQHDRTASVLNNAARGADERAQSAKKDAEEMQQAARELQADAEKLMNSTGQGIREEIEKIRSARTNLQHSKLRLEKVEGATTSNKQRAEELQRKIALIRDKIEEAREKAQEIRLSLHSDERGLCKRSYISPAHPGPSNTFSIRFRPLHRVPDSTILITKTKSRRTLPSEYIAIEVKDKRVAAHWNIGGGKGKTTNGHAINYIPLNDRSTWYHIDLERIGNMVNLTVTLKETVDGGTRAKSAPVGVIVGQAEPSSDVVFNTVPGETRLSLGTDEEIAKEIGLSTSKLLGVVGGLTVDDVQVPLWTFASTTEECEGANAPPQRGMRGNRFRDGFAQLEMSIPERTKSVITITFNAYSPSGMLYFRGSEQSGDFIAVMLQNGYIVFKVNLGGHSVAELKSKNTYADGREHVVKAIRNEAELHLQVDSDADRFNTIIPGENTAFNVDNDDHFVAGVPAGYKIDKFATHGLEWRGFVGCILQVKPSQITEFDLDHPKRSQRREPGCQIVEHKLVPSDRLVGFARPGFLLTQGVIINNNSTFGFAFRTREENGTLIFQSSKLATFRRRQRDSENNGKGYMAFYLFRGYLVLHFGKDASSRSAVVTFRSSSQYNDGQMHSVFMSREGKMIRLRVDDKEIGEPQTLSDESPVGTSYSQMLLGGFNDRSKPPSNEIPFEEPLIGCISDVFHNYKRIPLVPESHNALIGMCSLDNAVFSPPIDEMHDVESHQGHRKASKITVAQDEKRNYYVIGNEKATNGSTDLMTCGAGYRSLLKDGKHATRFGISKSSHSRINFTPEYPNITDFKISFSLKTNQPEGMVWVWANYKNYTRYFFFNILDGFATIEVKGHKNPRVLQANERRLNDDQWHDIVVEKHGKSLKIIVDELSPVEMADCPSPKVMRRRMYVGGVISKHRSQFGLVTPGFDGCLRDFMMNGISYQLDGEFSRDLIPCAKPTKGAYIHDGGFAVFDGVQKSIKDGSRTILIDLEFRPIDNEGVILAILSNSNPEQARLTIELSTDKILVTMIHAPSKLEIRDAIPALKSFCDADWHSLQLRLQGNNMTLIVDKEANYVPIDLMSPAARDLMLNLPLNIGGVSAPVADRLSMNSLVGCYRNLHISTRPKYFESAQKLNKVAVDACPLTP